MVIAPPEVNHNYAKGDSDNDNDDDNNDSNSNSSRSEKISGCNIWDPFVELLFSVVKNGICSFSSI